ncbi:MAG TPA: hypothetical protein VNS58_21145 [Puia sp.]|nr:hypothetical protein [Puia sp.]
MSAKRTELDVDFIGGMGPLTKEEEMAISEFIKANKIKRAKAQATADKTKSTRLKRTRSAARIK